MKEAAIIEIGERIKNARKTLQLQQKEMADALGVSASHLSEIESGKANPNADVILKISETYDISVEFIIRGRGKMFYDADGRIKHESFDFNTAVDTLDKLIWLAKNSPYFKVSILRLASVLVLEEEILIKKSLEKNKSV